MPLIPQYKFARLRRPSAGERKAAQDRCHQYIRQMRHCRQCRADAIGLLGNSLSPHMLEARKLDGMNVQPGFKLAVTTSTRDGCRVDLHFGNAPRFLVYKVAGNQFQLLEARQSLLMEGRVDLAQIRDLLGDCRFVITRKAGPRAAEKLEALGVEVVESHEAVDSAIIELARKVQA